MVKVFKFFSCLLFSNIIFLANISARDWERVYRESHSSIKNVHSLQYTCKYFDNDTYGDIQPNEVLYPYEYTHKCQGFLDGFLAGLVMGYGHYSSYPVYYDIPTHRRFIEEINALKDEEEGTNQKTYPRKKLANTLIKMFNDKFRFPAWQIKNMGKSSSYPVFYFNNQTSEKLYEFFKQTLDSRSIDDGSIYAKAYSSAYLDGLRTFQELIEFKDRIYSFKQTRVLKDKRIPTHNTEISNTQIMRVFVKEAEDNPQLLDIDSTIILKEILVTNFPGPTVENPRHVGNSWQQFISKVNMYFGLQ